MPSPRIDSLLLFQRQFPSHFAVWLGPFLGGGCFMAGVSLYGVVHIATVSRIGCQASHCAKQCQFPVYRRFRSNISEPITLFLGLINRNGNVCLSGTNIADRQWRQLHVNKIPLFQLNDFFRAKFSLGAVDARMLENAAASWIDVPETNAFLVCNLKEKYS